jgi:alpha-galactosidase
MRRNTFLLFGLLLMGASQTLPAPSPRSDGQARPASQEIQFNRAWAEQAFAVAKTPTAPKNRLVLVHEAKPGDTRKNLSSGGGGIRLAEKIYTRGLGVSSRSVLRVELARPAVRFSADIGPDRMADFSDTSVRFLLDVGGKHVFLSEFMKPGAVRRIDVPLEGAQTFDLILEAGPGSGNDGQADWADARVQLQDGSQLWLDDLADEWEVGTDLPFSFTLGGRPSREFLTHWKRSMQEDRIDQKSLRRTVVLQDPDTGLEIRAVATVYSDTPGVDWTLYLTNHGSKDTPAIEKLEALDVALVPGVGTTPRLHRLRGSDTREDDWLPYEDAIEPRQRIEFAPTRGKSSQHACPFFTLQYGGGGVVTAIGWSGTWNASVERQSDGRLHLQAGLQKLHLRLHPGESIRSPRILQLYWFGNDPSRAYNQFRSTMLSHIVPRIDGAVVVPPIVHLSTSFYELNKSTERNVLSHLESIKGLGFETLWLDAYWTRDGFPRGMGDYGFPIERAEPADRFPQGLRPVSDAVHREGMGFLVWFEPERVFEGTFIAKEHPEWVIKVDRSSPDGMTATSGLFNLGLPEAREYMTRYLIAAIKAYGIDCLRIDFNIGPGPFWSVLDARAPDRVGMAEIRYVEGLYKMWDDILQAYPHLYIDDCASGGQRIDLETVSRSIPLWRTDGTIGPLMKFDFNQAALQNQLMTAGLSRYVPFNTSGQMGATPYLFRSGFNGGISFAEDCRPAAYPRNLLRQGIAEGKRIRKYFLGNFYPLGSVTTSAEDWSVRQYHRTAERDGIVLAFRRHESPFETFVCDLNEIDAEARYEVTYYPTYEVSKKILVMGSELQHLKAGIADRPGSVLIEYREVNP